MSEQQDKEDIIDLCDVDEEEDEIKEEEVAFVRVVPPVPLNLHRSPPRVPEVLNGAETQRSHERHMVQPRSHIAQLHPFVTGHTRTASAHANASGDANIARSLPVSKTGTICTVPLTNDEHNAHTRKPTVAERQQEEADKEAAATLEARNMEPRMVTFVVDGIPKTKQRPMRAKAGHWFNRSAPDEAAFRKKATAIVTRVYGAVQMFDRKTPLRVEIQFQFSRQAFNLQSVPDIDNLSKFVLDSLNRVMYHDDRQVVSLFALKGITTGEISKTVVVIEECDIPVWKACGLQRLR